MGGWWILVSELLIGCAIVVLTIRYALMRRQKPIVVRPPPKQVPSSLVEPEQVRTPRPAIPAPLPPPPDVIPVAPESGLTIRKRPAGSLGPGGRSESVPLHLRPMPISAFDAEPTDAEPLAIDFDDLDSAASFTPSPTVRDPVPPFALAVSRPIAASLPPQTMSTSRAAMRAHELASLTLDDIAAKLAAPTSGSSKINYAVKRASLTMAGIDAQRDDGFAAMIAWNSIVDIVARRLPAEAPFDGATFIDIVSIPGATLRILPWTRLEGVPIREQGDAGARALVKLLAARCLDAKLDTATRLFADGGGFAVQLPTAKLLAAHDQRFA